MLPACCHERYCGSSSERLDYPSGAGCSPARRGYLEPSLRPEGAPMPPRGVKKGTKRARQYEHIKESQREQGQSEDRAEEIAARTVNKEKARGGESRTRSRSSTDRKSTRLNSSHMSISYAVFC